MNDLVYLVTVSEKTSQKVLKQFAVFESDLTSAITQCMTADVVIFITSLDFEHYEKRS